MRPWGKRYKIAIGKVKSGPYFWDENHKSLIFVPKITAPPQIRALIFGTGKTSGPYFWDEKRGPYIWDTPNRALISGTPCINFY